MNDSQKPSVQHDANGVFSVRVDIGRIENISLTLQGNMGGIVEGVANAIARLLVGGAQQLPALIASATEVPTPVAGPAPTPVPTTAPAPAEQSAKADTATSGQPSADKPEAETATTAATDNTAKPETSTSAKTEAPETKPVTEQPTSGPVAPPPRTNNVPTSGPVAPPVRPGTSRSVAPPRGVIASQRPVPHGIGPQIAAIQSPFVNGAAPVPVAAPVAPPPRVPAPKVVVRETVRVERFDCFTCRACDALFQSANQLAGVGVVDRREYCPGCASGDEAPEEEFVRWICSTLNYKVDTSMHRSQKLYFFVPVPAAKKDQRRSAPIAPSARNTAAPKAPPVVEGLLTRREPLPADEVTADGHNVRPCGSVACSLRFELIKELDAGRVDARVFCPRCQSTQKANPANGWLKARLAEVKKTYSESKYVTVTRKGGETASVLTLLLKDVTPQELEAAQKRLEHEPRRAELLASARRKLRDAKDGLDPYFVDTTPEGQPKPRPTRLAGKHQLSAIIDFAVRVAWYKKGFALPTPAEVIAEVGEGELDQAFGLELFPPNNPEERTAGLCRVRVTDKSFEGGRKTFLGFFNPEAISAEAITKEAQAGRVKHRNPDYAPPPPTRPSEKKNAFKDRKTANQAAIQAAAEKIAAKVAADKAAAEKKAAEEAATALATPVVESVAAPDAVPAAEAPTPEVPIEAAPKQPVETPVEAPVAEQSAAVSSAPASEAQEPVEIAKNAADEAPTSAAPVIEAVPEEAPIKQFAAHEAAPATTPVVEPVSNATSSAPADDDGIEVTFEETDGSPVGVKSTETTPVATSEAPITGDLAEALGEVHALHSADASVETVPVAQPKAELATIAKPANATPTVEEIVLPAAEVNNHQAPASTGAAPSEENGTGANDEAA